MRIANVTTVNSKLNFFYLFLRPQPYTVLGKTNTNQYFSINLFILLTCPMTLICLTISRKKQCLLMAMKCWKPCLPWQWLLRFISFMVIRSVTDGWTSTMNVLTFLPFQAFYPVTLRLETGWFGWDPPIPQSIDVIAD